MKIRIGTFEILLYSFSYIYIYKLMNKSSTLYPIPTTKSVRHIRSFKEYNELYNRSLGDPNIFWSEIANSQLDWYTPFTVGIMDSNFTKPINWFLGGKLNAAYNCVDRHAIRNPDKIALIWVSDDPKEEPQKISYLQLRDKISQLSNWLLKTAKIKKGDVVTIYMGMVPEIVISILACARIGAIHNVVFGGFSGKSLRERIIDSNSKVLISTNAILRGGKIIETNSNILESIKENSFLNTILIHERIPGISIDIPLLL